MRVALLSLLVGLSVAISLVEGVSNDLGYQYNLGAVQGHFKVVPFTNLYPELRALEKQLMGENSKDIDQEGNFFITGADCIEFIKGFRINKYKVENFETLVRMDSCLGYLFDSEKEKQRIRDVNERHTVSEHLLKTFQADTDLKRIYQGSSLESWNREVKDCLADVIIKNLAALRKWNGIACNTFHLTYLVEFASCQRGDNPDQPLVTEELRKTDTYLQYIYDIVLGHARRCYEEEIRINELAAREVYSRQRLSVITNYFGQTLSDAVRQDYERMYPSQLNRLLRILDNGTPERRRSNLFHRTGTSEYSLKRISQMMYSVLNEPDEFVERIDPNTHKSYLELLGPKAKFIRNIEKYATNVHFKSSKAVQRPEEYKKIINGLCSNFRETYDDRYKQFATSFKWLAIMTDFEDVFGISRAQFVEDILVKGRESAALYYGVIWCNLLDETEAHIERLPNKTNRFRFVVGLKKGFKEKVEDWPTIDFA